MFGNTSLNLSRLCHVFLVFPILLSHTPFHPHQGCHYLNVYIYIYPIYFISLSYMHVWMTSCLLIFMLYKMLWWIQVRGLLHFKNQNDISKIDNTVAAYSFRCLLILCEYVSMLCLFYYWGIIMLFPGFCYHKLWCFKCFNTCLPEQMCKSFSRVNIFEKNY